MSNVTESLSSGGLMKALRLDRRVDAKAATWCAPSEGRQVLGRLHVCKDQFCSRVERPAEVGEALPARSPVQQGNTQMLFEHFHLFPYQLRGQIQVVRSGAE